MQFVIASLLMLLTNRPELDGLAEEESLKSGVKPNI